MLWITEQLSIIEKNREITAEALMRYLPQYTSNNVPTVRGEHMHFPGFEAADREIIIKVLRDYRNEINDLNKIVYDLATDMSSKSGVSGEGVKVINRVYGEEAGQAVHNNGFTIHQPSHGREPQVIEVEESLSLQDKEIDMIRKALRKHKGKRKNAARELGISDRTLYRKINEYAIEE